MTTESSWFHGDAATLPQYQPRRVSTLRQYQSRRPRRVSEMFSPMSTSQPRRISSFLSSNIDLKDLKEFVPRIRLRSWSAAWQSSNARHPSPLPEQGPAGYSLMLRSSSRHNFFSVPLVKRLNKTYKIGLNQSAFKRRAGMRRLRQA